MKAAIVLGILSVGLVLVRASSSSLGIEEETLLVERVIQESTKKYDERMNQAFVNGAQTKKNPRELKKSTKYTQEIGRISSIYIDAFKQLINKYKIDNSSALTYLRQALPEECELPKLGCDSTSKYRSFRGTCNNVQNPYWGSINMPNIRLINPEYVKVDEPRGGLVDSTLPPAREVTLKIHRTNGDDSKYETDATHMVPQFGQFLDHDITLTPVDNHVCCQQNPPDGCWNITVQPTDPFYGPTPVRCLDFVRSTAVCFPHPTGITHREQMNIHTSYIDAGMVYGPNEAIASILRAYRKGRLAENALYPGFLPYRKEVVPGDSSDAIIAGDVRANEMPGLTVMHSLFLREHNRIANIFANLTDWDDEKIYQETRRIIAAEIQQVTYNEFLPSILGPDAMTQWELALPPVTENNGYTKYDPTVDATIISSFATAAYRFGHTLVNGLIQLMLNETIVGRYNVRDNYLVSTQILNNYGDETGLSGYDLILNVLTRQNAQAFDSEIHKDMSDHLFQSPGTNPEFIGTDLAARNVQRGRDHGTPSYNAFRRFCNISALTTWENRPADFSEAAWERLRITYENPEDIDLYTGGLSQTTVQGGLSGRTLVCIQAIQFQKLMKGDRYFFTHEGESGRFTPEQLAALRSRTLGDIICQNSALKETARNVFASSSTQNAMVPCSDPSRQLDVSLFTKEPTNPSTGSASFPYASRALTFLLVTVTLRLFT